MVPPPQEERGSRCHTGAPAIIRLNGYQTAYCRLGVIGLFRRPYLNLHEVAQRIDALDANLRAGVRVHDASLRVRGIVILSSIIEDLNGRQTGNR